MPITRLRHSNPTFQAIKKISRSSDLGIEHSKWPSPHSNSTNFSLVISMAPVQLSICMMFVGSIKLPFHRKWSFSTLRHIKLTQCRVFLSITKIHHSNLPLSLGTTWDFSSFSWCHHPFWSSQSPLDMVVLEENLSLSWRCDSRPTTLGLNA